MTAGISTAPARDESAGYRSPLLQLPGAVATDSEIAAPTDHAAALDLGVAAHYGDPLREQRNLVNGAGFVDLSHRAVVRISGDDRLKWLNDLTTQRLDALQPGIGSEALILSPQGHVEHHLQLVDDGEAVWTHVEPDSAKALVDFLTSMRFMLRVDVADVTADWAVVWEPVREPHPTLVSRVDPRRPRPRSTAGCCRTRPLRPRHRPPHDPA
jgi:hypothetical protein